MAAVSSRHDRCSTELHHRQYHFVAIPVMPGPARPRRWWQIACFRRSHARNSYLTVWGDPTGWRCRICPLRIKSSSPPPRSGGVTQPAPRSPNPMRAGAAHRTAGSSATAHELTHGAGPRCCGPAARPSWLASLSGPAAWAGPWQHPQRWPALSCPVDRHGLPLLSLAAALVIVAPYMHGAWQRLPSLAARFSHCRSRLSPSALDSHMPTAF